ncbi:MAG TPA: hypothetical protein VNN72_12715 [Polyangiaceae bacterium]|nr:hypothetical protein [Polyangiaceae bacterium]
MLARFALALTLAGCTSAVAPPSMPEPTATHVSSAPNQATPGTVRRLHRVARLSPPFLASSSIRHVAAAESGPALVLSDDRATP